MAEDLAVVTSHLTKNYGRKSAVRDMNLEVRRGEVFGFVGENGAGKTTTIRMLLGHARPTAGTVAVLGENPRDHARSHLLMARIGYVSESRAVYEWMRVQEAMDFCAGIRGAAWDRPYAEQLRDQYNLDPQMRVRDLSRGKRALLMLMLAVAHHPELLILDEPSSGLDPVARREILEQVIAAVNSEGRTVFFSSHLLDEVERVADRVGFMHDGRLVTSESLDDLHRRWNRVRVVWPEPREVPKLEGIRRAEGNGREQALITDHAGDRIVSELNAMGAVEAIAEPMSLDDIFVETVREN